MAAREITDIYASENGITYLFGELPVSSPVMLAAVVGSGLLFMAFCMVWMERSRRR